MSTTTWNVDPAHTEVGFAVRHLMISTVRGRFGQLSGTVVVDDNNPRNSKVDVSVDIGSIDTRQEMRDNHLRSPDFFDAAKYPTMHFVSKRIEGETTKRFKVVGDLTIKDQTHEVTLDASLEGLVKDPWGGERAGYAVTGKLNRSDFNLLWNQVLEAGGVAVGEEVKLSIDVELVKQVAAETVAA
jgi:polyisoprenoid-binding protein YceI